MLHTHHLINAVNTLQRRCRHYQPLADAGPMAQRELTGPCRAEMVRSGGVPLHIYLASKRLNF